jgi:hypothetical protein
MAHKKYPLMAFAALICAGSFSFSASADVTILNASSCAVNITINNASPISLTGASAADNWLPSPTKVPLRPGPGQPGEFGSQNSILLSPTFGGTNANFTLTIPDYIHPESDIQLYVFYCGSVEESLFVASANNGVFASGQIE